jgi:uncharacterized membrane protein
MTDLPPVPGPPSKSSHTSVGRLVVSGACGAVAGVIAGLTSPWQAIPLLFWLAAALVWVGRTWGHIRRFDSETTATHATREDPHGPTADTLLLSSSLAALAAVMLGILKASNLHGGTKALLVASGISAIVASWATVHTVFTLRYAALYYRGTDGGIDFNGSEKPTYLDFAYLAFTIGMTYQVSDTDLTTKAIRHAALRHALLSYLLGTVIIAATINLTAGLIH